MPKKKPIPTQTELLSWFLFQKSEEDENPTPKDFHKWLWEFTKKKNLDLYFEFYKRYPLFRRRFRKPNNDTWPK